MVYGVKQSYNYRKHITLYLNWLLSIIASIILVNLTVVIMVQFMIIRSYNDQFLTHRKIVQHQAKGRISSLIMPYSFRIT